MFHDAINILFIDNAIHINEIFVLFASLRSA